MLANGRLRPAWAGGAFWRLPGHSINLTQRVEASAVAAVWEDAFATEAETHLAGRWRFKASPDGEQLGGRGRGRSGTFKLHVCLFAV